MPSLRRPSVTGPTVVLGRPRGAHRWALVPLAIGVLGALLLPVSGFFKIFVLCLAGVFAGLAFFMAQLRIFVSGPRLVIRQILFWRVIDLGRLVWVRAVPATRAGPQFMLRDATGAGTSLPVSDLSGADRIRLAQIVLEHLDGSGAELEGPVVPLLELLVTGRVAGV